MNQDFYAYYSSLSTAELLQIQSEKEKYQPEAIEALTAVLQSRTITIEDQQEAVQMLDAIQQKEDRIKEKKEEIIAFASKAVDIARPGGEKTVEQRLILFCGGLSLIYLVGLYGQISVLYFIIKKGLFFNFNYFGARTLLTLVDIFIMPYMIYLLYKRKKAGWTIATFIYAFTAVIVVSNVLEVMSANSNPIIPRFQPSTSSFLLALLVDGGILYYLNTPKLIALFPVSRKWQFTTVIIAAFTALLLRFMFVALYV